MSDEEMNDDEARRAMGKLTSEEKLRLKVGQMNDRQFEAWAREAGAKEMAKARGKRLNAPAPDPVEVEEHARVRGMSDRELNHYIENELGVPRDPMYPHPLPPTMSDQSYEDARNRRRKRDDDA